MSIVYKTSDRIKIKVDDIVLYVSPLKYHDKNKIQALLVSGDVDSIMQGATQALKCAIKDVKGLKLADDHLADYKLTFDDNGELSDESLDDLMNLQYNAKFSNICLKLVDGIPDEFIDNASGEVMEGVYIIKSDDSKKKD